VSGKKLQVEDDSLRKDAKSAVNSHKQSHSEFVPFVAYGASATTQELIAVRVDSASGKLISEFVQREPLGFEGAPVIFDARHRLIYVASLRAKTDEGNQLLVISIDSNGLLQRENEFRLEHGSAYLSLDRTGRFLLSASYFDGHVDVYRLDERGLPQANVSITHEGRDKAHSVLTSWNNHSAYVAYVDDQNALFQYSFDEQGGKLLPLDPPQAEVPAGIGPRHIAYHPTKPFVYFSNEQHVGATAYQITGAGQLRLLQVCHPGKLKPASDVAASDIKITPDGRFLYVGVRDFGDSRVDAIHRYTVHDDGTLSHEGKTGCDAIPWGLQLSPNGQHLLVTASEGGTLTAFKIDDQGDLNKDMSIAWGNTIRAIAVVACER